MRLLTSPSSARTPVSSDIRGGRLANWSEPGESTSLAGAMSAGSVLMNVPGVSLSGVLNGMAAMMWPPRDASAEGLRALLRERAEFGVTFLPGRVACPHPHYPAVYAGTASGLLIAHLASPTAWGSTGEVVATAIVLVYPTVTAHLHLLARLMVAVNRPAIQQALARKAGVAELVPLFAAVDAEFARLASPAPPSAEQDQRGITPLS